MDYLWSPWRYRYITNAAPADTCVFCDMVPEGRDEENLVVHRGRRNFVVLNRYPYTSGHLMVVPYRHVPSIEELDAETAAELMTLAQESVRHLRSIYKPAGLNLGINIGESAGAGIAGHVHLHVLPRWAGDTNFMTAVAETRVLPEDLSVTWQKLRAAFESVRSIEGPED